MAMLEPEVDIAQLLADAATVKRRNQANGLAWYQGLRIRDRRELVALAAAEGHGFRNFRGINAAYADFREVVCRDADFTDANLAGTDFRGADLRQAQFDRANVSFAEFRWARLGGAQFRGAQATGLDLRYADAHETNWNLTVAAGCRVDGTDLQASHGWVIHPDGVYYDALTHGPGMNHAWIGMVIRGESNLRDWPNDVSQHQLHDFGCSIPYHQGWCWGTWATKAAEQGLGETLALLLYPYYQDAITTFTRHEPWCTDAHREQRDAHRKLQQAIACESRERCRNHDQADLEQTLPFGPEQEEGA